MPSITTASGSKKKHSTGSVPKGKLMHIHVTPGDNGGFTVESRHKVEPKKSKKGALSMEMPGMDEGMHNAPFSNGADAHAHIGDLMGLPSGGAPPAAPDAGGAPPDPSPDPGAPAAAAGAGAPAAPPEPDGDEAGA